MFVCFTFNGSEFNYVLTIGQIVGILSKVTTFEKLDFTRITYCVNITVVVTVVKCRFF